MFSIYNYNSSSWNIFIAKRLGSTMNDIKKDLFKGEKNCLLMAYSQSRGRGRNKNKWISQLGNLFFSIKLNTYKHTKSFIINYITSIVIYDTINFFLNSSNNLILKWPNDILGAGINLKIAPKGLGYETTCLNDEAKVAVSRKEMLDKLIFFFDYWENILNNNNENFIIKSWMKRSWPINTKISFKKSRGKSIIGIYKGIHEDGSIELSIKGKIKKFYNLEALE